VLLTSARLNLIAATRAMLRIPIDDHMALGRYLEAAPAAGWPPEHYDAPVLSYAANYLRAHPDALGWLLWYVVLRRTATTPAQIIGFAGFGGMPPADGTVEVGYSIVIPFRQRGYATEVVAALIEWAFESSSVRRVAADSLPGNTASIRVMQKNGLHYIGAGPEPGTVRYILERADYQRMQRMAQYPEKEWTLDGEY
jgi:RimJ/RimL family protein N-acetyltransferase